MTRGRQFKDAVKWLAEFEQHTGLYIDYAKPGLVEAFKIVYWYFSTFSKYVGKLRMGLLIFLEVLDVFLGYLIPMAWALVVSALTKILVASKTSEGHLLVQRLLAGDLIGFFSTPPGGLLLIGLILYALSLLINYVLSGRLISMWRRVTLLDISQVWRLYMTQLFNKIPFDILVFPKIQNIVQEIDTITSNRLDTFMNTTFMMIANTLKAMIALITTYVILGYKVVLFLLLIMALYMLTYTKIMQVWVKYNLAIRSLARVSRELGRWRRSFTNYLISRYLFWADYVNKLHYKAEQVYVKGMQHVLKQEAFYTIARVLLKTLAFFGLATSLALKTIKQGLDIGQFLFFYDVIKKAVFGLDALSGTYTMYFSDLLPAIAYGYKLDRFVSFVTRRMWQDHQDHQGVSQDDKEGMTDLAVVDTTTHQVANRSIDISQYVGLKNKDRIIELRDIQFEYPLDSDGKRKSQIKTSLRHKKGSSGFKLVIEQLSIEPGMNIAIVGPNGAGKTTLLQIIKGLYKPQKGTVVVAGVDPHSLAESTRLKLFAQVPQDFPKLPFLRVRDVVMFDQMAISGVLPYSLDNEQVVSGALQSVLSAPYEAFMRQARMSGSRNVDKKRRRGKKHLERYVTDIFSKIMSMTGDLNPKEREQVEYALKTVDMLEKVMRLPIGLNTPLAPTIKNGVDLSSGQWQRLHLARTVYYKRPLVVLDEPTSAIDPVAGYKIIESIFREFKEQTVLLVSHKYSIVHDADLIIVVRDGTIAEMGTHDQLMKKGGYYAKAYELEVSKLKH